MRPPRIRLFPCLLALALAALLGPTTAGATTYCVDKPSCAGVSKSSLQEALDAALAAGPDRIEIGATVGNPLQGGTYLSGDPLEMQGAGRGVTQLGGAGTVLTLGQGYGSSSVSVSDLTIAVQGPGRTGLRLDGARADRVDVHGRRGRLGFGWRRAHKRRSVPAGNRDAARRERDRPVDSGWGRAASTTRSSTSVAEPSGGGILVANPDGNTPVILDAQHVTVAGANAGGQVGATAQSVGRGADGGPQPSRLDPQRRQPCTEQGGFGRRP